MQKYQDGADAAQQGMRRRRSSQVLQRLRKLHDRRQCTGLPDKHLRASVAIAASSIAAATKARNSGIETVAQPRRSDAPK
jgi:hypothetical protein